MLKPTVVASKPVHHGTIIDVSVETLRYTNGREYPLDFVKHPGAAAIVPIDSGGRVCVVRQYRLAVDQFLWEVPAGKLDKGEAPAVCAVRELAEETGVSAKRWTSLGVYYPAPGLFTEVIHLYLAQDLTLGVAKPDVDEELELQWLPFDEAVAKLLSGEWNDGKTAVAMLRARSHLQL